MSDQQPYNEEQWTDLPLPDGDRAWEKMELLLDEDKRRRRIIPWWFWRYGATGLLLLGLAVGGWFWLQPAARKEQSATVVTKEKELVQKRKEIELNKKQHSTTIRNEQPLTPVSPTEKITGKTKSNSVTKENLEKEIVSTDNARADVTAGATGKRIFFNSNIKTPPSRKLRTAKQPTSTDSLQAKTNSEPAKPVAAKSGQMDSITQKVVILKDTTSKKDTATALPAPPVVQKKEKRKSDAFVWTAGIGLQKAIALSNQQSPSADTISRKRYFFDYFPSVYVKLQRGKWFAQAELAYSAPQPIQNFSFSQKTTYNASTLTLNTERARLQKLYYHQLSLNLNYHLLQQWSVGVGGVYNRLAGAVTEQEFVSKDVQTGAETVSKYRAPIKGFKDSFLYKTTAGLLLQTDYHWKRFSVGLRYTQNLQPFIKYTKPDGSTMDEKNSVLQAVLRFRLF